MDTKSIDSTPINRINEEILHYHKNIISSMIRVQNNMKADYSRFLNITRPNLEALGARSYLRQLTDTYVCISRAVMKLDALRETQLRMEELNNGEDSKSSKEKD